MATRPPKLNSSGACVEILVPGIVEWAIAACHRVVIHAVLFSANAKYTADLFTNLFDCPNPGRCWHLHSCNVVIKGVITKPTVAPSVNFITVAPAWVPWLASFGANLRCADAAVGCWVDHASSVSHILFQVTNAIFIREITTSITCYAPRFAYQHSCCGLATVSYIRYVVVHPRFHLACVINRRQRGAITAHDWA